MLIDARIPVRLSAAGSRPVASAEALLVLAGGPAGAGNGGREDAARWAAIRVLPAAAVPKATPVGGHEPDCACCAGRDGFTVALGSLVRERAVGSLPFFRTMVIEMPRSELDGMAARLLSDPFLAGRYRLDRT